MGTNNNIWANGKQVDFWFAQRKSVNAPYEFKMKLADDWHIKSHDVLTATVCGMAMGVRVKYKTGRVFAMEHGTMNELFSTML